MEENNLYTLINGVKDDLFDVDNLHTYLLSLQVSNHGFRFGVFDNANTRILALEDYKFLNENKVECIEALFESHAYLKAGFWKSIKLFIRNAKFTLVPHSLFSDDLAQELLALNCKINENEKVAFYKHTTLDIVNIFALEQGILNRIQKFYPNKHIEVIHHSSMFMEGVINHTNHNQHINVFAFIEDHLLTIAVRKEDKLLFVNNFKYQTANDIIYFILFVYEEIDLNPEVVPINISGDVDKKSEVYEKLYRFIRFIKFTQKPKTLKLGYLFDEINEHRYFGLLNAHLFS